MTSGATQSLPVPLVTTVLGCLLHDVGKPVQRAQLGYRGRHSAIGRAFLMKSWLRDARNPSEFDDDPLDPQRSPSTERISSIDREILDAVSFHHYAALRAATEHGRLAPDAPAYVTYIADNIAAGTDRRKADADASADGDAQWQPRTPLYSVFNRFGQAVGQLRYAPELLDDREPINFAADRDISFDKERYTWITEKLGAELGYLERTGEFVDSLLNVLEATCSFVPSSTDTLEVVDISLFDHLKLTAAFGAAIWHYLVVQGRTNFRRELLDESESFYAEDAFRLVTFDLSGIQDFIYTIHSSGAAKMLRSRSLYLEILSEHLIDELLARTGLTRANLNYSGGGHAYLLMPNTPNVIATLSDFAASVNDWFLEHFGPRLFFAHGSVAFSARDVMRSRDDTPDVAKARAERYAVLYQVMSEQVSATKLSRYSASQLWTLNHADVEPGGRECRVCHAVAQRFDDGLCPLCASLAAASPAVQDRAKRYLVVTSQVPDADAAVHTSGLSLPFDRVLTFEASAAAAKRVADSATVRIYAKNKFTTGRIQGTRLWIGDFRYPERADFSSYAQVAAGIERMGVLRFDVDNLGGAFTRGFMVQGGGTYNTISRTAAFSRSLSIFFRQHVNYILEHPTYRPITGAPERSRPRQATIIYSGGDDVFVVGAWDDVVEFAIELRRRFGEYAQGKLTGSAGLGMFPDKYPIEAMAREVGDLEAAAKAWRPEKDAVALFAPDLVFDWDELAYDVIGVKLVHVSRFLSGDEERGAAFVYRLLRLLGERNDPISHARWVYLLARARPTDIEQRDGFTEFAGQLHRWFLDPAEARRLTVALYLYVYSVRGKDVT